MKDLKITIIQSNLHWENKEANLHYFSQKIAEINVSTDIIVLPEMFSTGFSMHPEKFAESMDGPTISWMKVKSQEKQCILTGSFICEENSKYYNRLIWMRPDGTYSKYDKRHLFRMAKEDDHYTGGDQRIIVELKGWKICPLICYDLRFPVWSRNKNLEYDVLLYIANWPEKRAHPWKTLLMARAIENQCYVVGVNRVGEDGNGIKYSGDSAIINPTGVILSKLKSGEQAVETIRINYTELEEFRKAFPVALDADDFIMKR